MTNELSNYEQKYPSHFYETPRTWIPVIDEFFDECYSILSRLELPLDTVQFLQIKEKFGRLRIYFAIDRLYDDDISGLEESNLKTLRDLLDCIVDKYEVKIRDMVKDGKL